MMLLLPQHPAPEAAMLTIPQALRRIKGNLSQHLPEALLRQTAADLGFPFRERTLTPVVTTYLFLQQVLQGNVAAGKLHHLSGLDFTDSAYCQARARLPLAFFQRLRRAVLEHGDADRDQRDQRQRWHGHRLFLLDGSSFSMPDTPELQQEFGQPGGQAPGCGFPTAHLLALFDAPTGYLLHAVPAPLRTHDMAHAACLHHGLKRGDVLVGDRAFCSYAHLALCRQRRLHGLFRAHQRLLISFRPRRRHAPRGGTAAECKGRPRSRWLRCLGRHDQVVEYYKPDDKPDWMSDADYAALPDTVTVRELRFRVRLPGRRVREITVVTTLLDATRYTKKALAKLYELRWQVEVNLRHLKTTLKMDVLHSKTFMGILKEVQVFVIVYNLVRRVMEEAARRQEVSPSRISFADALQWLQEARPGDELPLLKVTPERPERAEPRVRKRRPKQYDLMNKPRAVLRKRLMGKRCAA
jgi:Transposase DDE domain